MATLNVKSYNNYSGNGASTEFSIDFPYISKDYISVYLRRYGGEQQKLTVDVDYAFLNDTTIKFPKEGSTEAILQEGDNLSIQRETPRGSEYIFSNQKRLFPEDVMDADDLSFQQIQELESTLDRTIKISQTATGTKIPNLTIGTIKPNKGLKWNEDGITIESTKYDPDEQADIAMGQAAIATEKANEAAQSASEAEDYNNQAKLWAIGTIEEQPEGSAKYWVDKVLSTDWDDFRKKSVRMPFDVFFSLTTETPEGAYPLWTGETISNCNTVHPEFWELLLEKKEAGTIKCVSSSDYESNIKTYGQTSAFVVDENAGSVRLPKITRFISSLTKDSDFAKIDLAGAPSITHKHMIPRQFSDSGSGYMGSGNGPNWDGVYTAENTAVSPIYGRSNTIQPEAVRLALYIQVDSNSSNAIALMTTLSLKELQEEADKLKEELSQIAGKQNLSELDDVTITDAQNNQALIYKDGSWINRFPCTNGVGATFVGVGATSIGSGVAVGWNSNSTSIAAAIGHSANALGPGSVALGDGSETTTNATYGTALGFEAKSDAKGAIQIGWGENSDAHTFKVSLMESETGIDIPNYTLLKEGGIIPPERLPILKGTTAPGSTTVGVVGQTYVDTTNEAAYVCVKADIETPAYTWEKVSNESAGATALSELEDVTITTPTDGQGLVYDGEKWKNKKVIVNTGTFQSSIGFGINSTSSSQDSIAIGNNSISDSDGAIAIGRETKAQGNRVVVIGGNASATSDAGNGVAIGTYAKISGEGSGYQIAIGGFSEANAERSIQLGGLGTNNEAYSFKVGFSYAKNYKLLDGKTGHIPAARLAEIMIVSDTAPTTATVGALGDLYKDTSTGTIYKCTVVDSSTPSYTWSEFGAGAGEIDAYTKTETDALLEEKADKATTLSGYGITDAYTKTETDALLASKQNTLTAGNGITIEDNVISATAVGSNLSALDDVTITDPTDGQVLTYNATDAIWENTTSTSLTNTATGNNSLAIGTTMTVSAQQAIAIGHSAQAKNTSSLGIGVAAYSNTAGSVAVGNNAQASSGLVAIGTNSSASAINAMAFGHGASASGNSSLAVGGTTASGSGAIAIGTNNKASGSNAISIGGSIRDTSGQYSLRIGYNARQVSTYDLTGNYGIGIGYNAYTTNQYGIAIGANASVKADYGIQLGRGSNTEANTLYVGLSSSSNYKLLNADGTIPASRLAEIMIVSDTAPTTATVGALGDLYKDTSTGTIYKCTAVDSETPSYTWSEFGTGIDTSDLAKLSELNQFTGRNNFLGKTYFYTAPVVQTTEITFVNPTFEYNAAPSSNTESTVSFKDKNGAGVGSFGLIRETDGDTTIALHVRSQNGAWSQVGTTLRQTYTADGVLESRASVPADDANDDRIATTAWTNTKLESKQNTLTAGDGITIVDNVISASGGGLTNNSTDDRSLSVGEGSTASDPSNTVYRGSTAFGYEASANNKSSTALGAHSSVNGSSGVAVGSLAESDSSGVAVGWQAFAHDHCVSIGHNAASQNGSLYGTAVGCSSFTSDNYCVALGNDASAYGIGSIAIGSGASALDHTYDDTDSNTIVIGHNASSGSGCITIGEGANTTSVFYDPGDGSEPTFLSGENAIAIGKHAQAAGKNTIQLGSAENTEAGTFKVCLGESGTNYMLLDADGKIPAERLVNAPGGMEVLSGTDYPNPEMVGEVGQVYIKTDDETAYMCTGVIAAEESTGTTYSYTWKEISYVAPIQPTVSVSSGNSLPDMTTGSGKEGDIYIAILGETAPYTYVPYICTHYDLETGNHTWAKIVSKNYAPGSYVDDFVVAASGSEYTALSDGFVWATRDDSQGWVQLRNKETLLSSGTIIANYGSLFLPVSAGDKFTLEYYEGTVTLKMVASKGE